MADDPDANTSSEEDTNEYFKNPMKRRIHDIQKLNLQNKEMLVMAGHNKKLAQSIIKQKNLTKLIQSNQTKNFANTSLCGCTTTSRFRSFVMQIVFNSWFDKFILLTIFANCISLAIEDPSREEPDPLIEAFDLAFLIIFSIEMVLKIIAMGFVMEAHSYLRDPWNILDFSVVILGWFSLSASSLNVSAIRVIRILRPLRTLNSLQGMRGLVLTLLNSLPSMLNILVLFFFTLIISGTIGVQLFKGMFRNRCVSIPTVQSDEDDWIQEDYLENRDGDTVFCQDDEKKPELNCPEGYVCLARNNPGVGLQNWDNIFVAILTQFELITLEGWTDVMYKVRNASAGSKLMDIFFITSVVFGAFFVLNLMIAVQFNYLDEAFAEVSEQTEKAKKEAEDELKENLKNQELKDNLPQDENQIDAEQPEVIRISCWQGFKKRCSCLFFDPKTCCCKCWMDMSFQVERLIKSTAFQLFIVLLILLNSITLATEHYNQPTWLTDTQKIGNIIFTILFTFEMILNLLGLGIKDYVADGFNIFDAIIVIVSLIDLAVALSQTSDDEEGGSGFITVLRGFRLLRIFKLVKSWETLQQLLKTIIGSMTAISNLAILALLFLFVYSLIGKQFFFGDMVDEDGEVTRYHFNSTIDAMITMFIVLTGENWNYVLNTVAFANPDKEVLAIFFFVSAMLIGNFMLLNLFLAILLKFLQDALEETRSSREQLKEDRRKQNQEFLKAAIQIDQKKDASIQKKIYGDPKAINATNVPEGLPLEDANNDNKNKQETNRPLSPIKETQQSEEPGIVMRELNDKDQIVNAVLATEEKDKEDGVAANGLERLDSDSRLITQNAVAAKEGGETGILRQQTPNKSLGRQKSVNFTEKIEEEKPKNKVDIETKRLDEQMAKLSNQNDNNEDGLKRRMTDYTTQMVNKNQTIVKVKKRLNEIIIDGNSLGCIGEKNKLRIALGKFCENPYFESFVFNLIGLNSVFLAIEEPTIEDEYSKKTLELFGDLISILFLIECTLKIFVMGFAKGKYSYLKDNYNRLDFIIVVFSLISWTLEGMDTGIDISYLRALRALRALRPLKLVSKNEGMKLVVNSILASIPNLINVFMISILFYFVFGVIGLQMLMGKVSYCLPENFIELDKIPCEEAGGEWILPENNYNTVFASMTTFFEVSTLETWPDIMFAAIDSQEQADMHPVVNNRKWISLLFISFIFVTTFFVMNLFISVIVGQFTEQKEKSEGSAKLSDEQKEWVKIQRFMAEVKAPVIEVQPENPFRLKIYQIVTQNWFDQYFITSVIVANTITMCMDYHGASEQYLEVLDICNLVFVCIFTMEAVLKLIGLGPTYYFYIDWNKFDFAVVILSLVSIGGNNSDINLTALRIIRVARLLRMIKSSKELQSLLMTLYLAMNNIANVALLFMLIIFTFSVAGMTLFGDIEQGHTGMINYENLNFRSFYNSGSTLIRSSTGESWNQVMHDCAHDKGLIAYFYWMIFQMFAFFIFLNVFIAVIYEEFQNVNQVESTLEVLSLKKRDIQSFLDTWGQFNQGGQNYMATTKFTDFMRKLPAPLGYKGLNIDKSKLDKIIFCLNIRDHEGYVYFPEVMWAIFYSIIGKNDKELHECKPMRNIMRKVKNKYSGLGRNTSLDMLCGNKFYRNEMTITKYLCGKVILNNLRKLQKRKIEKEIAQRGQDNNLGETKIYLEEKSKQAKKQRDYNFIKSLWLAITRKPADMSTRQYKHEKLRITKQHQLNAHASVIKS